MSNVYRTVWGKISNTFVAVVGSEKAREETTSSNPTLVRAAPNLMVLEPRLVFDGAAVETFVSGTLVDDTSGATNDSNTETANADLPLSLATSSFNQGPVNQEELDNLVDVNREGTLQLIDAEGEANEVVIIDSRIPDLANLLGDVRSGTDVWLLDAGSSALDQISSILSNYQNLDALHIVSHGSEGEVYLGAETIASSTLANQADTLAAWGSALSSSGDILLYGCDVAAGEDGMSFVRGFAAATGADVAASDDATGADWLGGDWELETHEGSVETTSSVAPQFATYDGLLSISGTAGNDSISGTVGDDTISGLDGNDTISAMDGSDLLYGDGGNDTIYGGGWEDTLYGGEGNDFLYGATGDDLLYGENGNDGVSGGDGNDTLYGGAGNDTVIGSSGDDYLSGGDGNDWMWGGKGNDLIWGDAGNDTISGGDRMDTLYGGEGNDTLSGHSGDDCLYGGDGNDLLRGGQGADELYGGAGEDTFTGSARHLDGDTLGDLEIGDVIQLTGVTGLTADNIRFNGSGLLEIDTNGTDFSTVEVTFNLGNAAGSTLAIDTVSDFGSSTLITFKSANEVPVITSDGGGATATVNVSENQTAVTTVTATDADNDTPTFSITGGSDKALFSIDATTGALSFVNAPNFESASDSDTNNAYVVEVTASDGQGGTTTQTITVSVTDAAEAPVITSDGGGATAAVDVAENQTTVTTVTATDEDNDTPSYSITGGTDQTQFTIDAATGALSFVNAPNFEAPGDSDGNNSYEVEVTASDGLGGTVTQMITVSVTDTVEAPVITSDGGGATATVNVTENQTAVTTVTATDEDNDTPTFSITGGSDQTMFTIDANSGALRFVNAPDFEAPGDIDGNNSYEVEVTVSDGQGGITTQTITVNVNEENLPLAPAPIEELIIPPAEPVTSATPNVVDEPQAFEPSPTPLNLGANAATITPPNLGLGSQTAGGTTDGSPLAALTGTGGSIGGFSILGSLLAPRGFGGDFGFGNSLTGDLGNKLGASGVLGGHGEFDFSPGVISDASDGTTGRTGTEENTPPSANSTSAEEPQPDDGADLNDTDKAALLAQSRSEQPMPDTTIGKPTFSEQLRLNGMDGRQAERATLLAHARAVAATKEPNA